MAVAAEDLLRCLLFQGPFTCLSLALSRASLRLADIYINIYISAMPIYIYVHIYTYTYISNMLLALSLTSTQDLNTGPALVHRFLGL
jgi:hypothetical protein